MRNLIFILMAGIALSMSACKMSEITALQQLPTTNLAAPSYPATQGAIKSADTATLAITLANANTQTLTNATGTSSAAPSGLTLSTTGTASCSTVQISGVTSTAATISTTGCTGDGTLVVRVASGVIFNNSGVPNAVSSPQTVIIENTPPTVVVAGTGATIGADGSNVLTATFSSRVKDLSTTSAGGEVVVSGCSSQPTVGISTSTVGTQSVATLTLSGGSCVSTTTVSVQMHLENVTDLAGNAGQVADNPSPTTYVTP